MIRLFSFFIFLFFSLEITSAQTIQPSYAQNIPASSSIATKVHFEQVNKLPACRSAVNWLFGNVSFLNKQSLVLKRSFNISVPKDLSSIVAFSDGLIADQSGNINLKSATSIVTGRFDSRTLEKRVASAKGCKTISVPPSFNTYSADFAPGIQLAFPSQSCIYIASSLDAIRTSLNTLSKKNPPVSLSSPIAKELNSNAPVSLVVIGKPDAPNLSLISGGLIQADANLLIIRITETPPNPALLSTEMTFDTPETAAQVFATLNGLKLLVAFQKNNHIPEEIIQRFLNAKVALNGSSVSLSISLSSSDLSKLK